MKLSTPKIASSNRRPQDPALFLSRRPLRRARTSDGASVGFETVANSEFYANSPATNPYELGRVAMLRDLPIEAFRAICHDRGLWKKRLSHQTRRAPANRCSAIESTIDSAPSCSENLTDHVTKSRRYPLLPSLAPHLLSIAQFSSRLDRLSRACFALLPKSFQSITRSCEFVQAWFTCTAQFPLALVVSVH